MARVIRRLGVLGGTFDPIHHAHLVAAEEAQYQLDLDQVLLVPAGTPPHKPQQPMSPSHHRFRMVELAIGDNPHLAVSRVDIDRDGPCYTVDTLAILKEQWASVSDLFFIEGADSLADILTWHQPERLIELCELAVVARPGVEVDLGRLDRQLPGLAERVHWVQMPRLEISSSDLRARVREGRPISYLVPPAVQAYILEHRLYQP
jgi:nicotinate-nucleotide adenylyltransferase